jgi:hypothetical protein
VLELSLRSCNVLIEKFHHSLFLYLQSSPDHYVSLDMYIVAPVALLAALLLQAAASKRQHDELPAPAERGSWAGSMRRVLAAHVACAVLGLGLRRALQQPGALAGAGVGAGAQEPLLLQPRAGPFRPWAAAGCAAVLVASALSCSRSSAGGGGGGAGQQQLQVAALGERLRARVALLSLAAMLLSALLCLNWALAYSCLLVVSPLAVLATCTGSQGQRRQQEALPGEQQQQQQQQQQQPEEEQPSLREPVGLSLQRRLALAVLSPVAAAVYLQLLSGNGLPGWQDAVGMVVASRGLTYMAFWSVYVPFWWLCSFSC